MKRILPLILVLTLAACGDTEDPSTNNGNTNNNQPDQGNNNNQPDMNVTPDQGTDMTTPTDLGTDMDMNVVPDQGTDMNNGGACALDETFRGQVGGRREGEGGNFVTTDASYTSAGLKAVNDLILAKHNAGEFTDDDPATMGANANECSTTPLVLTGGDKKVITGAIVTSTFGRRVTLQDKDAAILMFLENAQDKDGNPVTFKVGQKLNFTVTSVLRFGCETPQISGVEELVVVGGEANSDVYVQDMTGQDITVENNYQELVRVGGKLVAFNGPCGGENKCFMLEHGPAGATKQIIYRTKSMFLTEASVGTCINFVGPVSSFPGPLGMGTKAAQLDSVNYDWTRTPR